jgi:hypothetical protein
MLRQGTVISNLLLRAQEQYPAVQLIGKDLEINNGGEHPWTIGNGYESKLLLFNHAARPTTFNVKIASGAARWHQEYTLAPNETRALSIGEIIKKQGAGYAEQKPAGDSDSGVK